MRFFGSDSILSEVVRGAGLALILRVFGAGFAFLLNVIIGRLLGIEGAGYYFLALSVASMSAVVARLGLDHTVLRYVATEAAEGRWGRVAGVLRLSVILVGVTTCSLALGLVLSAGLLSSEVFGDPALAPHLRWIALSICGFSVMMVTSEALKGLGRIRDSMLVSGVIYPATGLVLIWPLVQWLGAPGAAFGYSAATLTAAGIGWVLWQRALPDAAHEPASFELGTLWRSSNKLWVMSMINSGLLVWAPLFLLGIWGTAAETGLMGVALRVSVLVTLFLTAVNAIATPKFARLLAAGDLALLQRTSRRFALLIIIGASPILAVMILAPRLVMSLFGTDFAIGGTALMILAVGQAVNAATGLSGYLLLVSGNERDLRTSAIVAAVVMLICAFTLIPAFGLIGAALTSAAPVAVMNLANLALVKVRLGYVLVPRW